MCNTACATLTPTKGPTLVMRPASQVPRPARAVQEARAMLDRRRNEGSIPSGSTKVGIARGYATTFAKRRTPRGLWVQRPPLPPHNF